MHRTQSRRRSAARLLSLAAAAGLGIHFLNADDQQGGGGAGKTDDKGQQQQQQQGQQNQPKKHELTDDELQAKIDAAVKAQQDRADAAAKKKADEDERKKAEEQGEFKKLLDKETEKNAALAAENRTLKTRIALGDHLAAKHPEYVARARYILPLIPADTADDQLAKAVETAAAEFVRDNPVQAKGSAAAPAAPRGGNIKPPTQQQKPNGNRPTFTGATQYL